MEINYFLYKTECKFVITSEITSPEILTAEIGILPSRSGKIGEMRSDEKKLETFPWPHNFWELSSKKVVSKVESVSDQLKELFKVLNSKFDIISRLMKDKRLNISFWISVETNDAGYSLELNKEELAFINSIANRVNILFLTGVTLEEKNDRV